MFKLYLYDGLTRVIASLFIVFLLPFCCTGQDNTPALRPGTPFNEGGVPNGKARFFLLYDALDTAVHASEKHLQSGDYNETLFFANADQGVAYLTRVLRAGGLSDESHLVLDNTVPSNVVQLEQLLHKLSVPAREYDEHPATLQLVVPRGTKAEDWPIQAKLGDSKWIDFLIKNQTLGDWTPNLYVAFFRSQKDPKQVACGLIKRVDFTPTFLVSKAEHVITIAVGPDLELSLGEDDLSQVSVFRLESLGAKRKSDLLDQVNYKSDDGTVFISVIHHRCNLFAYFQNLQRTSPDSDYWKKDYEAYLVEEQRFQEYLRWATSMMSSQARQAIVRDQQASAEKYAESRPDLAADFKMHLSTYVSVLTSIDSNDGTDVGDKEERPSSDVSEEVILDFITTLAYKSFEKASNQNDVKKWVDIKISEAVRRTVPPSQQGVVTTIEQALEKESKLIVNSAKVGKTLLRTVNFVQREKKFQEVVAFAREKNIYAAWKATLEGTLSDVLPGMTQIVSPIVAEVVTDSTVDVYASLGNQISWWMWDRGYSPFPPRFARNEFDQGVPRPPRKGSPVSEGEPTVQVPPAENGVPDGPTSSPDQTATPDIIPPSENGTPYATRSSSRLSSQADSVKSKTSAMDAGPNRSVPRVEVVPPTQLPPPFFNNTR